MNFKGRKQPAQRDEAPSELIRRFKTNPLLFIGTVIILLCVILAFVAPPFMESVSRELNFGSYNKTPITWIPGNYFDQVQEAAARENRVPERPQSDDAMAEQVWRRTVDSITYQVWRRAFESTVIHLGILDEMAEAGYKVPEALVNKRVAQRPQFQEDGRFSPSRYRQLNKAIRMSLWREDQANIAKERFQQDIFGLQPSSPEEDFIADMASPQRSFDLAAFPFSSYPDTEIIAHIQANPALFQVTHLYRITVSSNEKEAQQILQALRNGTSSFEDAAKNQSQDSYAEKGGDMGLKMVFELATEIPDTQDRETVCKLQAGEYSPVVKVPLGWAFFRANTAPYPVDTNDSASLDRVRSYILEFERGRMENWLIEQANQFIALVNAEGFDAALSARGQERRRVGPLPVNYGNVNLFPSLYRNPVQEAAAGVYSENFWKTAFFTPLNTPSKPIVIGDTVLVLFPFEETAAGAELAGSIKTRYASWLMDHTQQSVIAYFLANKKLRDTFLETYSRYFLSSNDS